MLNERKQKKHYHLYNSNCTTEMKKIDIEYLFIVILDDLIVHDGQSKKREKKREVFCLFEK